MHSLKRTNSRQSLLARAVLSVCHPWQSEEDAAAFRAACATVQDWTGFAQLISSGHCASIALRNLEGMADSPVPCDEVDLLISRARQAVMLNLRNDAELRYLEEHLFGPEEIECVHVKGASLGRRYYPDPALRMYRDIDVLLLDEDRLKAIKFGARNGYRFFVAGRELIVQRDADIAALYEFGREVAMVSPRLATIELHKSIDKAMRIFPPERLFDISEVHDLPGGRMRVLPTNWLFCYLAYHACQHNWTKLIWMVDLIVLMRAKDFSWPEVREVARESGVQATVEGAFRAALRIKGVDIAGMPKNSGSAIAKADQIVDAVLRGNGLDAEGLVSTERTDQRDMSGAMWLGDGWNGLKFGINRLISLSSPGLDDYRVLPVDVRRSHVHFYLRPFLFAYRRVRSAFGGER
jgi:hypothetical protein